MSAPVPPVRWPDDGKKRCELCDAEEAPHRPMGRVGESNRKPSYVCEDFGGCMERLRWNPFPRLALP